MGKKKVINKNNPDAFKEAGNKAFAAKNFDEAISNYSQAIAIQPNHIYYANRANAYLEKNEFEQCITDCEESIKLEHCGRY